MARLSKTRLSDDRYVACNSYGNARPHDSCWRSAGRIITEIRRLLGAQTADRGTSARTAFRCSPLPARSTELLRARRLTARWRLFIHVTDLWPFLDHDAAVASAPITPNEYWHGDRHRARRAGHQRLPARHQPVEAPCASSASTIYWSDADRARPRCSDTAICDRCQPHRTVQCYTGENTGELKGFPHMRDHARSCKSEASRSIFVVRRYVLATPRKTVTTVIKRGEYNNTTIWKANLKHEGKILFMQGNNILDMFGAARCGKAEKFLFT